MKSPRKIKIQPKYILRKYDRTIVPEILLKGKWLEDCGFSAGQQVKIELNKNKLIITRLQ